MSVTTHNSRGFTIVELLIVIVVIGILATVTIVAYNGIQQRARNAQVISGVQQYIKALNMYVTAKGQLPLTTGAVCLGDNYPSNFCWNGANGVRTVSTTFDANLSEFMPTKPTLATKLYQVTNASPVDMRAGATINLASGQIVYYLEGVSQNCTISGSAGGNELQMTQCAIYVPTS